MAKSKPTGPHSYQYPRPALTVDVALVTAPRPHSILLIRRKKEPFQGKWAFPGGFVDEGERIVDAARRELREETGVEVADLEEFRTFGEPGRDPRGWNVSIVFFNFVEPSLVSPQAADDAAALQWFDLNALPEMAFDHAMIIDLLKRRLADRFGC